VAAGNLVIAAKLFITATLEILVNSDELGRVRD
jgi:hypothetical protein